MTAAIVGPLKWLVGPRVDASRLWSVLGIPIAAFYFRAREHMILLHVPPDWWSWWDQGQYLTAARAFHGGDWTAAHHWYPPGYSLLAAPFVSLFPADPFVAIDLLCLVGSLLAVARLAAIMELGAGLGVLGFLFTVVLAPLALEHYVLPWTSTPSGSLILVALCLCLSPPRPLSSLFLGAIAGAILTLKPIDDAALAPAGLYYLARVFWLPPDGFSWRRCWRNLLPGGLAFGGLAAAALLLHWEIYGWHLSAYEAGETAEPLFFFDELRVKLFGLFIDPGALYGHFHQPVPLLKPFPWLLPGLCGMIVASWRKLPLAVLSASVAGYVLLYAAFYDLTPSNLWYYNLVHYLVWTLPVFGLFCLYLLKEIFVARSLAAAGVTALAGILVLGWHSYRVPLGEAGTHAAGQRVSLDLSACAAPCIVELDIAGPPVDEETTLNTRFDQEPARTIERRTLVIQPGDHGVRILLLETTGLGRAVLTFPGDRPVEVEKARLYRVAWRFL